MNDARRFFVKIEAPNKRALLELGKMGLDLFAHTTVAAAAGLRTRGAGEHVGMVMEGLLDMNQVEQLVRLGYRVTVEEDASRRARAAQNVIEFEQWLKEMGE